MTNPRTPSEKALVTHAKSISAVAKKLEHEGWYAVPFVKRNKRFGVAPKKGIVDLVALRLKRTKIKKRYDVLQIVLFQLKSGDAQDPDEEDRRRLQRAVRYVRIGEDYADFKAGKVSFWWEPDVGLRKITLD